jgi:hypothetical protein
VANFHLGPGGKDCVKMCADEDDFFFVWAAELGDDIAGFVSLNGQADFCQLILHGGGALGFLKWRSGDFRQARLLGVDPGNVEGKPIEGGVHS